MMEICEQIKIIRRGTVDLIEEQDLVEKLSRGKPLRIKAGFDPTAPDLHLGHTVLLQKLKVFQDLGHQVIFLIGDHTAMIGDPTGQSETRPVLSERDIKMNVMTYEAQISKVLDKRKIQVVYNSAWLAKMSGVELLKLASSYNVARMLERDDFAKRYKAGRSIRIHEFLYPLLQGYDSVQLRADVELGGADQKFNLLIGRELQREAGQAPQIVITVPLLVGTDGVRKMSKSFGNHIPIAGQPNDMFGKVMSIPDTLMGIYFELLTDRPLEIIEQMKKQIKKGELHPRVVKQELAMDLVRRFHGEAAAKVALNEFERVFREGDSPTDIEAFNLPASSQTIELVDLLVQIGLVESKSEAKRLVTQGAVEVNSEKVGEVNHQLACSGEYVLRVGKRRFKKAFFK